jgi:hypothetical protein
MGGVLDQGMPPHQVADHVLRAIKEKKFYILPDPTWKSEMETRMNNILQERNPGQ